LNIFFRNEFTPYQHSLCFNTPIFLTRAKELHSGLRLLGDLHVPEKFNDHLKTIGKAHSGHFSGSCFFIIFVLFLF
jgi:hypothetical protein